MIMNLDFQCFQNITFCIKDTTLLSSVQTLLLTLVFKGCVGFWFSPEHQMFLSLLQLRVSLVVVLAFKNQR